jgi:hypothetical protein
LQARVHGPALTSTGTGIAVEIAAQMPRQELRLQVPEQADRHRLLEEAMRQLLALALMVCDEHRLAALPGEEHGAALHAPELLAREWRRLSIDSARRSAKNGRSSSTQVERQPRASRPVAVEEADGRVEADRLEPGAHVRAACRGTIEAR